MKHVNTKIVISELHRAFTLLNENLFEGTLPEPAILIQSRGNKKLTLGWCTVKQVWKNKITKEEKYEINLVAEGLNRGIYPVMATLLHEMVHLHNLVNNIKDVSRGNTYHNMKFKRVAESHGLLVEHSDKIGWSLTKLQGLTMDLIDSAQFDEAVFSFGRIDLDFDSAGKPRKKAKTSSRKYQCPVCGGIVRTSKDMNILCGDCTNLAEGKLVSFIKIEAPTEEGEEPKPTTPPVEEPQDMEEYNCKECGAISMIEKSSKARICPACGCIEEPEQPEPSQEPEAVQPPKNVIEIDTHLNDGAGNLIPVKQGKIDVDSAPTSAKNTGWTVERITEELEATREQFEELGMEAPTLEGIQIEIHEKMISQWAIYKEGNSIFFSKKYIKNASDVDIVDTIKHEYIHHYMYMVLGKKVSHRKEFKALCDTVGIDKEIPLKNHRAMK